MGFKVIIIGGGLAGSLLANGLIRHHIDCMLYERDEKASLRREGYQIRIGDGALSGFRACLDASRFGALMEMFGPSGSFVPSAPALYDIRGNCLLDLGRSPWSTKSACINRVLLRNFLTEPVYQVGKLQYGKRFSRFTISTTPGKPDRVRVDFEDGSSDLGDILISAEGSHSSINSQVGLNNLVQTTSHWQFLSRGNISQAKLQSLIVGARDSPLLCFHENKRLWFSAYKPFVANGAENEGTVSAFCSLKVSSEHVPPQGGRAIEDKLQFCLDQMRGWDPRLHDLLLALEDKDIYAFQERASTQPSKTWRSEVHSPLVPERGHPRVWLMGDAIHAMLTQRGQGGNQSMADAAELLSALLPLVPSSETETPHTAPTDTEIQTAVLEYEKKMLPRAFGWVKSSGGTGGKLPDPSGLKGTIGLFIVNRVLDVIQIYGSAWKLLGYRPKENASTLDQETKVEG